MTLIFERKFRFFCTKAQRLNQYSKFISFKNGKMLLKQHYHGTDRFGKETASFPMSPINAKRTGNILRCYGGMTAYENMKILKHVKKFIEMGVLQIGLEFGLYLENDLRTDLVGKSITAVT